MILEVRLKSGRVTSLTRVYFTEASLGVIEGRPSAESKRFHLGSYGAISGALWPSLPSVVLGLEGYLASSNPVLPRFKFIGTFESYRAIHNPQRWGSTLVCVWYQNELHPLMSQQNQELLTMIAWEREAVDFDPF